MLFLYIYFWYWYSISINPVQTAFVFWKSPQDVARAVVVDLTSVCQPPCFGWATASVSTPDSTERAVWIRYAFTHGAVLFGTVVFFWHAPLTGDRHRTLWWLVKSAFCLYFSIQKKRKQTQQGGPDSGGTFAPCVCGAYPLFLGLFLSRNRTKLAASTFFVCRIYVDFPPWTMGDSVFLDRQNSYLVSVAFIWLKCNGLVLIW